MGAALPVAMIATQVVGGVAKGIGRRKELRAGAAADEANAQLALLEGEEESLAVMRDERAQSGDAMAALAGSGLLVGEGSARDVLADSAFQRELDIMMLRKRAYGQFQNDRQAARDKRRAGRNAVIGSVFGAVSTALQGASDMRNQRLQRQQSERERTARRG